MKIHLLNAPIVIFHLLIFSSCNTNEVKNSAVEEAVITKLQSVEKYIEDLQKTGKTVQVLDLSNKQLKEG